MFWNADEGCLYDTVSDAGGAGFNAGDGGAESDGGDEGRAGERRDRALRADQVLAIGLPFPALSKQRAQRLLRTIEERLYTPVGLRAGDGAGTGDDLAWPWLLGPFLTAQAWLRGAAGRRHALELLAELDPHLSGGVIGTIAELVGAASRGHAEPPYPLVGHGAHAASVGELLRVYVHDLHPPKNPPRARAPRPLKAKPKPAAAPRQRSRRARPREV